MKKKLVLCFVIFLMILCLIISYTEIFASAATHIIIENEKKNSAKTIISISSDITADLKKAFSFCKEKATCNSRLKIIIPDGEYKITSKIEICSYTTLLLSEGVIIENTSDNANFFVSPHGIAKYNGLKNFKLSGGTLKNKNKNNSKSFIKLAHSDGIEIENTTFSYGINNHYIEIAGCRNVKITESVFKKQVRTDQKLKCEAIQLDILDKNLHFTGMGPYDNTMNNNITISGCEFDDVVSGIGNKSISEGYYQNGINIVDNIFNNIELSAIDMTACLNSNISGNVIANAQSGICFSMMRADKYLNRVCKSNRKGKIITNAKLRIYNNDISLCEFGIKIFGNNVTEDKIKRNCVDISPGNYRVENVNIFNNKISFEIAGIIIDDAGNSNINGNHIYTTVGNIGIYLKNGSAINSVSNNFFDGMNICAIRENSDCKISIIQNNRICNIGRHGLILNGRINCIKSNVFEKVQSYSIYFTEGLKGYIFDNKFNNCFYGKVLY